MFTITHIPTGLNKSFDNGKDAYTFFQTLRSKKIDVSDIDVFSSEGVAITAYDPRIGATGTAIIERLEKKFGGNIVPRWHYMQKNNTFSTGRTFYSRGDLKVTHIAISAGTDPVDILNTILHEFAHAISGHNVSHGRAFYRQLFALWEEFLPSKEIEAKCQKREEEYIKSSRYWYAEYHGLTHILAEYGPRNETANVLASLFS